MSRNKSSHTSKQAKGYFKFYHGTFSLDLRDPFELAFLLVISSFSPSFPGFSKIAEKGRMSIRSAKRCAKRLEERGIIRIFHGAKSRSNRYEINWGDGVPQTPPSVPQALVVVSHRHPNKINLKRISNKITEKEKKRGVDSGLLSVPIHPEIRDPKKMIADLLEYCKKEGIK